MAVLLALPTAPLVRLPKVCHGASAAVRPGDDALLSLPRRRLEAGPRSHGCATLVDGTVVDGTVASSTAVDSTAVNGTAVSGPVEDPDGLFGE